LFCDHKKTKKSKKDQRIIMAMKITMIVDRITGIPSYLRKIESNPLQRYGMVICKKLCQLQGPAGCQNTSIPIFFIAL